MDKHIVHSDESGNDDDSCDDNHNHVSLLVMKPFVCSKLHVHKIGLLHLLVLHTSVIEINSLKGMKTYG